MPMDPQALDRPLDEVEFVAIDLETTGLEPARDRIVEFGALRFRLPGEPLGVFEELVDPGCRIPREATVVHGITDAMVRGRPGVGDVLPGFFDFLGGQATILLAHNASFDLSFLRVAATRQGLSFPRHAVLDTLDMARMFLRGLRRHRLVDVARHLRVAEREDHRALSDARLVMESFRAMVARRPEVRRSGDLLARGLPNGDAAPRSAGGPAVDFPRLTLAIQRQTTIEIIYLGGSRQASPRRITPRAIQHSGGRTLLTALCHIDRIEKTFRIDRIVQWRFDLERQ